MHSNKPYRYASNAWRSAVKHPPSPDYAKEKGRLSRAFQGRPTSCAKAPVKSTTAS